MTGGGEAGREAWGRATTLEDVGELTARWLEGDIAYHPLQFGGPDEETGPLRETLAAANRRGFVTSFSQPGAPVDETGSGQRASVEGRAREDLARRLGALGLWTELLVFVFPAGDYRHGYQVPVTVDGFHPFAWLGGYSGDDELDPYAGDCSREAMGELAAAWTVKIVDPRWGREAYLWEHLSAVLEGRSSEERFAIEPAPHLGLGTDLVF